MDDDLDNAIEKATEHTREAEERFRAKPIESPDLVDDARTVAQRAEDLHELAADAAAEDATQG